MYIIINLKINKPVNNKMDMVKDQVWYLKGKNQGNKLQYRRAKSKGWEILQKS